MCYVPIVNSDQFKRWLAKEGCLFEPGKGGHLIVRLGDKVAVLPQHGGRKQLKTGTVEAIKKQLGLK